MSRSVGLLLVVLAGCQHAGGAGTMPGARAIAIGPDGGEASGATVADRSDGFVFDLPPAASCQRTAGIVMLRWKPTHPGQRLTLTVRDPAGAAEPVERTYRQHREHAFATRDGGRFQVEVAPLGPDDAAAYQLTIQMHSEPDPACGALAPATALPRHSIVIGLGGAFPLGKTVEGGATETWWAGWMFRPDLALAARADIHAMNGSDERRLQLGVAARWWPAPDYRRLFLEAHVSDDRHAAPRIRHGLDLGAAIGYEVLYRRHVGFDFHLGVDVTTLDTYVDRNQLTFALALTLY